MKPLLNIDKLNLKLGKTDILKSISMSINKGEVVAIIGPNGCGKSSLAYTIMGLKGYTPDKGNIFFKGKEISDYSIDERARAGITLSWQEPSRFEGVTVREFLALGLKSRGEKVNEKKINQALREVAIIPEKYLNRYVDETLSGGERKRIELASILLMDPELVILDEPDSGVDVVALNNIGNVINNFKEKNTGVLLITHSEEMLDFADRAALICNGKILKKGVPGDISRYFRYECTPCEDENYKEHVEKEVESIG
ncbi:MAG: ABC transporter ATP-binding protein [Halanaerobiales bacterium]